MAKQKQNLTWTNVYVNTMTGDLAEKYKAVRAAFETVKQAKQAFEAEFVKVYTSIGGEIPAGHMLVFSHLRGLAIAIAPVAKAKSSANAISLSKAA